MLAHTRSVKTLQEQRSEKCLSRAHDLQAMMDDVFDIEEKLNNLGTNKNK